MPAENDTLKRCECSPKCTAIVKTSGRKYAWGHNSHLTVWTAQRRKSHGESIRNSPNHREAMDSLMSDPDWQLAQKMKGLRLVNRKQPQSLINKRAASGRLAHNRPDVKLRDIENIRKSWVDPVLKKQRCKKISLALTGMRRGPMSAEHRKSISKSNIRAYREGRRERVMCQAFGKIWLYNERKFRSSWEVAFARWCDSNKIRWEYEKHRFDLKTGSFLPDFYLPDYDLLFEVKGFATDAFWKRLVKFHKLFPDRRIILGTGGLLRKWGII